MAKKKSAAAAVQAVPVAESESVAGASTAGDATNTDTDDDVDELELLQVDLGDMVKLKQVLDESVAAAVLEHLPEDYVWDNTKLTVMFVACCFAMIAQFAPIPFPESRPVLGICGSLYFALSGVLQLIATLVDKDTILWTQPLTDHNRKEGVTYKNKDLEKYGVRVRSSLPRFSEWFTVTLEFHVKDKTPPPAVSQTWSVGQFFDKEGYFDETGLTLEMDKLFARLDEGKYDATDKKTKKE
jgi:signal peptidase complex subunit 2